MRSRSPAIRASRQATLNNFLLVPLSAIVVFGLAYASLDRGPVDVLASAYRATHVERVLPIEAFWPLLHFSIYVALSYFGYRALRRSITWLGVYSLALGLGFLLECAQALTATRSFEFVDIMSNLFGSTVGISLALMLEERHRRELA